jgi:inhibitor of KinA sporulation pathway (predicted exonuclease)
MDYIVMDIEFNGRKFASDLPMEVIEIGAVRLDETLQRKDEFTSLIKPVYFSRLNKFIRNKTGIAQVEIDRAPGFRKVIAEFEKWLKRSGAFLMITWGGEDLKRIVQDVRMHKLDDSFWLSVRYFDLLKGYLRCKNLKNDVSVETALIDLGLSPAGTSHRALEDARMTAEVFRSVFGGLQLDRTQQYKDAYSNAKERRMVKQAIRTMSFRNVEPTWEMALEHFLKDKIALTDPRKLAELKNVFDGELEKLARKHVGTEGEAETESPGQE